MALRKDIQTVMETQGARMTYHIANCLRSDFGKVLEGWYNGTLDTSTVRRELERMEKDGLVHRIPSSYSRQICWQKGGKARPATKLSGRLSKRKAEIEI